MRTALNLSMKNNLNLPMKENLNLPITWEAKLTFELELNTRCRDDVL